MGFVSRSTDRTRVFLETGLLTTCCCVVVAVRSVISADTLSDQIDLALNAAGLTVLFASALVSFFAVRAMQSALHRAGVTLMSLALVCLTGAFVCLTYPDVSIELADLVAPAEAAESAAHIVVGPSGHDVRLSGDIKDGAADLLESLLKANPSITRIHLTSEGGFAEEGQALADVIAAHHLTTYVPDYCVSACTLAFVAGQERILMDGARLGFHAPYQEGLLGQTFAGDGKDQRAAYVKAGLSADFVDKALKTSPDDIWIPEKDQLLKAHVVTGYVDRYRFPDSILDGAADGQGAREAVLRNFPVLKSLDTTSPQVVDRIADWYLASYRRGSSEGEATDGLKTIVDATLTLVLARADDATLLDLARYMQSATRADGASQDCLAARGHFDLTRALTVQDGSNKGAEQSAENLVARAVASGRKDVVIAGTQHVAFVSKPETCVDLQRVYTEALKGGDVTPLRLRLQTEAPDAARLLAPLTSTTR